MTATAFSALPVKLAEQLHRSFIEGVDWPIDLASLAALLDMGLSPQQIAGYFSVSLTEVMRLIDSSAGAGKKLRLDR